MALQAAVAGIDAATWTAAALLAPVAVVGAVLGHLVSGTLSSDVFRTTVLLILIASGLYMLVQTLLA